MPQPHLTRRGLALAALVTTGVAAGCTPGPTVSPRGGARPSSAASQDTWLVDSREAERALVTALAIASGPSPRRTAADATLVASLRKAHAAHLAVLDRVEPLHPGSPTAPGTHATPAMSDESDWKALSAKLRALGNKAQRSHRAAAVAAKDPAMALLFCSLSTFAALNTSTSRVVVDDQTSPAMVEVGSRTDALGVLLSRLRALAEGLEIGLGQVPSTDKVVEPMRKHLAEVWAARDRVEAQLRAEKQEVPPAELGYVMPGGFSSVAEARKTWAALEDGVTAGWARVAAASTGTQREQGLDAMLAQARVALAMGAPLTRWPGWV